MCGHKVKYDRVVGSDIGAEDGSGLFVRPAGQSAYPFEQAVSAHLKLGLGDRGDDDGLPVVYGAGLHQQHLPILVDQHLHLLWMLQGIQHRLVKQDAAFLKTEGQLQRV